MEKKLWLEILLYFSVLNMMNTNSGHMRLQIPLQSTHSGLEDDISSVAGPQVTEEQPTLMTTRKRRLDQRKYITFGASLYIFIVTCMLRDAENYCMPMSQNPAVGNFVIYFD